MGCNNVKANYCQYDTCKNKLNNPSVLYCANHRCKKSDCNEKRHVLSEYCIYHRCSYPGCNNESYVSGHCNLHYSFIKQKH